MAVFNLCVLALLVSFAYVPVAGSFCNCSAFGKYHYKTYDGAYIRFNGTCDYMLVETKPTASHQFKIKIDNQIKDGVFKRTLYVELNKNWVTIRPGNKVKFLGSERTLPFNGNGGTNIRIVDGTLELYMAWMLKILFDGKLRVTISVPDSFKGHLTGMCGNCNGQRHDDYVTKGSTDLLPTNFDSASTIGKSYMSIVPGSTCGASPVLDDCTENANCFKMIDKRFRYCGNGMKQEEIYEFIFACKVDVCMATDKKKEMCSAYKKFTEKCLSSGVTVFPWKKHFGCEDACDASPCKNSGTCSIDKSTGKYKCKCLAANSGNECQFQNPCQPNPCLNSGTCDPSDDDDDYFCSCTEDYIGDTCDTLHPCQTNPTPCQQSAPCYPMYDDFYCACPAEYTGDTCNIKEQCLDQVCSMNGICSTVNGTWSCKCNRGYIGNECEIEDPCYNSPCKNGGTCTLNGNSYKCTCPLPYEGRTCNDGRGVCLCRAFGDKHYITFDNQLIHFMGKCKYTLAATKSSTKLPEFSVEVKNIQSNGNPKNMATYSRFVDLKMNYITFRMLPKGRFMMNGTLMTLPLTNYTSVSVEYNLGWLMLKTDCGLYIEFDGRHRVYVSVPSRFMGNLTGICGDCNLQKDDYKTKNGEDVSSKPNKFSLIGASYQVVDDSSKPETNCTVVDFVTNCQPDPNAPCTGPADSIFKDCLNRFDKSTRDMFIESCQMDVCYFNNTKAPLWSLEFLSRECEKISYFLTWRKQLNFDMKCDAKQDYKSQTKKKAQNCVALPIPYYGDKGEGCICDGGLLLMGDSCVDKSKCGCVYKGMTIQSDITFITPDCSEKVKCTASGPVALPGCIENEDCLLQGGKRVCACSSPFIQKNNKCLVPEFPAKEMKSALEKFVRVAMAYMDGTPFKTTSTDRPAVCAVICANTTNCKSFNFDEMKDECNFFDVNAVNKTLVTVNCPFQDYYQLIESQKVVIRGGTIFPCGPLTEYAVVKTLEECKAKCDKVDCKSMEYSRINQECSFSNNTGSNFEINGDDEFVFYGKLQ